MKLSTHFFSAPPELDAKPHSFTTVSGDFTSVQDAVQTAQLACGQDGNGATEFLIENEAGDTLAHLILTGASWRPVNAEGT
jgi:hypothetical protein